MQRPLYLRLYKPTENGDAANWIFDKSGDPSFISQLPPEFNVPKLKSTKMIDTRTFTRPKKKFARPSINDIEQMYLSGSDVNEMNSSTEDKYISNNKVPQTVQEEQESESPRPVQFDLSQPTSLHNFDSFTMNGLDIDSFQNMSPPSLVNSLCSSTFANLMESSFIKNDPVLREIRDKDFTETAMLQDIEAPMFQSISESLSSINSDTPENFLKKVSRDQTFRRNVSVLESNNTTLTPEMCEDGVKGCNETFDIQISKGDPQQNSKKSSTFRIETQSDDTKTAPNKAEILNGTYRRTPKHHGTFRKADLKNNRFSLNLSYDTTKEAQVLDRDVSKSIENDMNTTNKEDSTKSSGKTVILSSDSMEELKKGYSCEEQVDLNRITYCQSEKDDLNATYTEEHVSSEVNSTVEINKRSSLGSADSLDRMSSLSSSSKGSNCKVLSMEDVQAIVEMQERSLAQVMSTPKGPIVGGKKSLWAHNFISPIVANNRDHLSDSDLSDDYKSVNSQPSSKVSLDNWTNPSAKNLPHPIPNKDVKIKTSQRSAYTISNKPLQALPSGIRGSYSNISTLKNTKLTLGGSQQNLYRPPSQMVRPPSTSNLQTMGTKLKGSYTSLRPISANLPVAPPIEEGNFNGTQTITRSHRSNKGVNVAKMQVPAPQTKLISVPAQVGGDSTFVKPQSAGGGTKTSGLPRPTGIPRPASRIPGPRSTTNLRPVTFRSTNY
ncbi:uncharacterized protein LOC126744416 isoform X2 [Anthonomus grandis grandis]|uniref:uncharacterized protein LOC126744416 isoform X2 n=1 Tax=Anthonomus grandis grandis TaxID=2921223 RepID=UPI0021663AE6|nr:uncharacterized protein LOC126744416 isoform X2 [Anthonomus grandis grandis]